jgi:diguanylate cyclase (GGDEF)-like protein
MIGVAHITELGYVYYYSGLMQVLIGVYTLLRIRFWNSVIAGAVITMGYQIVAIFIQRLPFDPNVGIYVFLNNNFFLLSTNVLGIVASYHIEKLHRKDFTQKTEILNISIKDTLTGLYNRRKLDQTLIEETNRTPRSGLPLSVIIIDIDHFKQVNDDFGHQVGDRVLIKVANLLKESIVRKTDIVGRWGGEEFMIVCPYTDINGASLLAEKLREVIETAVFDGVGKKTCSFGISEYLSNESVELCVKRADVALYRAKENGRNRIEKEQLHVRELLSPCMG